MKHIKSIKVCDLWKIVRSVISDPWWPCFSKIKYIWLIFVEAHLEAISARYRSLLCTDWGSRISFAIYEMRTNELRSMNSCTLVSVGGECPFSGVVLSLSKLQ